MIAFAIQKNGFKDGAPFDSVIIAGFAEKGGLEMCTHRFDIKDRRCRWECLLKGRTVEKMKRRNSERRVVLCCAGFVFLGAGFVRDGAQRLRFCQQFTHPFFNNNNFVG